MPFLKSISDRIKSCAAVEMAVEHHGRRVAAILNERYGAFDTASAVDFWSLQQFLRELLATARDKLEQAERDHVHELADDAEPRERRDETTLEVRSKILGLRSVFEGVYQPADIEALAFPRRVAREPAALLRQAEHLVEHLANPELSLPPPALSELAVSPQTASQILAPVTEALRTALADVTRETKQAEATRLDRNRALEEFDLSFLLSARGLEALYNLAGEEELAARVRPSTRRPGRTEKVVEGGGEEGESPGGSDDETPPEAEVAEESEPAAAGSA